MSFSQSHVRAVFWIALAASVIALWGLVGPIEIDGSPRTPVLCLVEGDPECLDLSSARVAAMTLFAGAVLLIGMAFVVAASVRRPKSPFSGDPWRGWVDGLTRSQFESIVSDRLERVGRRSQEMPLKELEVRDAVYAVVAGAVVNGWHEDEVVGIADRARIVEACQGRVVAPRSVLDATERLLGGVEMYSFDPDGSHRDVLRDIWDQFVTDSLATKSRPDNQR